MAKKQIRIYGCGGAGSNISNMMMERPAHDRSAELIPSIIDTSRSNLSKARIDEANTYLVNGLDGSGKVRAENHQEINKTIKQILVELEPTEFNIVVFSASGGSGSVIGPLLLKELNERNIPVACVVVGSDESVISAQNTMKTLQSLEAIAQTSGTPVIMSFHHNPRDGRRSDVDKDVRSTIASLAVLASGHNEEMDYRDLVHFLNYAKVNGAAPQLATLYVVYSREGFEKVEGPVSVASLYQNPDQSHIAVDADYHSVGYTDLTSASLEEIHFVISDSELPNIYSTIKGQVDKMSEKRAARVKPDSILTGTNADDSGLVL